MDTKRSQEFIMDFEQGIIIKNASPDNPVDIECRICFEKNDLFYPCNCTTGIHKSCLREWMLTTTNQTPTECEICKQEYTLNYAEIFPEQNIQITNPRNIITDEFRNWSSNELVNDNRLSGILRIRRERRNLENNKKKKINTCIIFLSTCDFVFILTYFAGCGKDQYCKELTGILTLSVTCSIVTIMVLLCIIDKICNRTILL